jgi:hypothetical protein
MVILSPDCVKECCAIARVYGGLDISEDVMTRILCTAEAYRYRVLYDEARHAEARNESNDRMRLLLELGRNR